MRPLLQINFFVVQVNNTLYKSYYHMEEGLWFSVGLEKQQISCSGFVEVNLNENQ